MVITWFWAVLDRFGWFWLTLGGFGWFLVLMYDLSATQRRLSDADENTKTNVQWLTLLYLKKIPMKRTVFLKCNLSM